MTKPLNARSEQLLKTLISKYIGEGSPAGSKALSVESGLDVSPATIRNILHDLEQQGLVQSPHTSAGRIPTAKGYRMFIDSMLNFVPVEDKLIQQINYDMSSEYDANALINKASTIISQITEYAGVVMIPNQTQTLFRQIEFLSLSPKRILAILITDNGRVQNRVMHVEREYEKGELVEAANFFNHHYSGKSIALVKKSLIDDLAKHSHDLDKIISTSLHFAKNVFSDDDSESVVVSGKTNLLNVPEFNELKKVKDIFEAFKKKNDLFDLLDKCLKSDGMQVFIGEESGYDLLNECSVVSKPYKVDGQTVGVLGVVGPTRMAYSTVIPVVDLTAKLLTNALSQE